MLKIQLCSALALALTVSSFSFASESNLTAPVDVNGGNVVGTVSDGLSIYKGIPFAAPPVRENRWRDPQPVVPWKGDLIADSYSPMCMQPLRAKNSVFYNGEEAISEDCLYLNVWAAKNHKPTDKKPVMVFIYGGGWTVGSGSMPIYSGANLAKKGTVVVTFNYRVGNLGFYTNSELTKEAADHTSGNYGLKDMIAALNWVTDNISKFGGDPDHVTVYGQSAGAAAISLLMASPEAKGLFMSAIGESGGYGLGGPLPALKDAEAKGDQLAGKLKVKTLADLRNLGADAILAADNNGFKPILDGRVFTEQPSATYEAGRQMHIPILVGTNADEATAYPVVKSAADFTKDVNSTFGAHAADLMKLYPAGDDKEARASSYALFRDRVFASAVIDWALAQSKVAPTYAFYYDHVQPFEPGSSFQQQAKAEDLGAYHGSEMVYAYDNLAELTGRNWTDADRKLSTALTSYWTSFAKTGTPETKGEPKWPRFDPKTNDVLIIGDTIEAGPFPNAARLDALKAAATH